MKQDMLNSNTTWHYSSFTDPEAIQTIVKAQDLVLACSHLRENVLPVH